MLPILRLHGPGCLSLCLLRRFPSDLDYRILYSMPPFLHLSIQHYQNRKPPVFRSTRYTLSTRAWSSWSLPTSTFPFGCGLILLIQHATFPAPYYAGFKTETKTEIKTKPEFLKPKSPPLLQYSLYFVYTGLVVLVSAYFDVSLWMWTGERQSSRIRTKYLRAILRQDVGYFDVGTSTGEVVSRVNDDTLLMQDAVGEKVRIVFL
jgi:ABC-type multidrug transport system fused ATPase/permease subunit